MPNLPSPRLLLQAHSSTLTPLHAHQRSALHTRSRTHGGGPALTQLATESGEAQSYPRTSDLVVLVPCAGGKDFSVRQHVPQNQPLYQHVPYAACRGVPCWRDCVLLQDRSCVSRFLLTPQPQPCLPHHRGSTNDR